MSPSVPLRWIPLALALLAVTGCDPTGRVEQEIAGLLPRAIGPADDYTVTVEGLRARSGEADRVAVVGTRVRPEGAPVLDRLDLELRGVRFDRGERRLERVDAAEATARITPADLAALLETRDGVRSATVTLRPPDEATIRLRPDIGDLRLPPGAAVEMTGRLSSADGQVRYDVDEVRALGLDLGETVARRLSGAINPIADLAAMTPTLDVTGVRVEGGAVVVEATGDLAGLKLR